MKTNTLLTLLLTIVGIMTLSCNGGNEEKDSRTAEQKQQLDMICEMVDKQSPSTTATIDSVLAKTTDSLFYYDLYCELGRLYILTAPDSTLYYANKIMQFIKRQQSTRRVNGIAASAYNLRANYNYLYHQNYSQVQEDNLKAYHLFMKSDVQKNAPSICANIGDLYTQEIRLPEAAAWYRRALVLNDSLKLGEEKDNTVYMGLGRVYQMLEEYDLSEEYYAKSRKGFEYMQPNMKLAFLNNYGNLQYFKKDYAKALVVFQKMDSLINEFDCQGGFEDYLCRLNMADVLLNLGRTEESLTLLAPADSFFRANNIGDAIYYANTIRIGNLLQEGDMTKISTIIANEPKGLTTDENMIDIRDHYFYDYFAKKNDMAKANYYHQKYTNRKDSLDRSREHMRASDIMTRLTMDTLTLHNQLRMEEKNAVIERNKLIFTIIIGGVLLAALALLAWILFLRKRNVDKQLEIVNLKIANTRSSIAPHFIFNVLSHAISHDGQDTDKAINGVIDLMHSQLEITKHMFVTLGEELDFVKRYVEVAKPTIGDDFTFTLSKPQEDILKSRLVPSTFIQILAENSIKHGLRGLNRAKELKVEVTAMPEETIIVVSDNGRGFDIRRSSNGTGTGLSVIRRTIALHNERHRHKIKFNIENLTDNHGELNGCKAILSVPKTLGQ